MKKIDRRNFLKAMGVTAAATGLAACGAQSSSVASSTPASSGAASSEAEPSLEPVTIKVAGWDEETNPVQTNLSEAFTTKFPHITVEIIDTPSADYTQKLSVMLNGGAEVDVVTIKDADTTPGIAAKGQLLDLTPLAEADGIDLSQYSGVADNFIMEDGKLYGMPTSYSYYILYYNKDIFDAANEPYPTNDMTWEDFEATAKRITAGEGADKKYGALIHSWNACVMNWAIASGDLTVLSTDFEAFRPYYEMVLRMQNDDKTIMDYGTLKTGNIHYSSPFLLGNIGMMPMGQWFMATMVAKLKSGETDVNWGIATIPHSKEAPKGYVVGSAAPSCINAASKNKEAAWEYLKFISGKDGAAVLAGRGQMPCLEDEASLELVASVEGMPTEGVVEALKVENFVLDRPMDPKAAEANNVLKAEHDLIMLGEISLDEGIANMGKYVSEVVDS